MDKVTLPVPEGMCACGRPLHYTDMEIKEHVTNLIKEMGETVIITIMNRHFEVPRHYIALHGIHTFDLLVYNLFPEITELSGRSKLPEIKIGD